MGWTGSAILRVSSVMIGKLGEGRTMERKHRNHSVPFKAKVAVDAGGSSPPRATARRHRRQEDSPDDR